VHVSGGSRIHGQGGLTSFFLLQPPLSFFLLLFFPSFLPYFSLTCKHVGGGAGAPPAPTLDPPLHVAMISPCWMQTKNEGPDRRPEVGLNGSLKFDPKIEEEKVPIQTPHHCF